MVEAFRKRAWSRQEHEGRSGPDECQFIEASTPGVERNGTVPVWHLVEPQAMRKVTAGGLLELVDELEVAGASWIYP